MSQSSASVWKDILAPYDGRAFVSWPSLEEEFELLFNANVEAMPAGFTARELVTLADRAGWLVREEDLIVLHLPEEWQDIRISRRPRDRPSALAERQTSS
jgi:hypothetical protein